MRETSGGILTALRLIGRVSELFVVEEIWKTLTGFIWLGRKLCKKIGLHKGIWISRGARLLLLASQGGLFCQI